MRIFSRKALRDFIRKHANASPSVESWYREAKHGGWKSFAEIREHFRSADSIQGNRVVFNLSGNRYRLIVKVAYKTQTLYIKFIGTHSEYDKIDAGTIDLR